jgi:hypothetical protein
MIKMDFSDKNNPMFGFKTPEDMKRFHIVAIEGSIYETKALIALCEDVAFQLVEDCTSEVGDKVNSIRAMISATRREIEDAYDMIVAYQTRNFEEEFQNSVAEKEEQKDDDRYQQGFCDGELFERGQREDLREEYRRGYRDGLQRMGYNEKEAQNER